MNDPIQKMVELSSHVPDMMLKLFSIERKSDLEKYLNNLVITKECLVRTILSCPIIGYHHERRHYQYVPLQLKEKTPLIPNLLKDGDTKKVVGILNSIFEERKLGTAHLFEKAEKWHVFYFDQRDVSDKTENHWECGAHVHFVNYLWANLTKDDVWNVLAQKGSRPGGIHIRFKEEVEKSS
jgi:hypothetical protein